MLFREKSLRICKTIETNANGYLNGIHWHLSFIDIHVENHLSHRRLNEIARDPPLIPWRFLKYFRASESTKINHMRNNQRHKIRFQDVVYSKLNKWRAKMFKNIDEKTSNWIVKLISKQEINILFLYCPTKCPAEAEEIEYANMS